MEEEQMLTKEQILDMLDAGQYKELKEELGNMYPVDIAETLEDFEQKPLVMVFRLLAKEEAAETAEEPVEEAAPEAAELVIVTERVKECNMQEALKALMEIPSIQEISSIIREY